MKTPKDYRVAAKQRGIDKLWASVQKAAPEGISYSPGSGATTDKNLVRVGDFLINPKCVSLTDLKKFRQLMPGATYKKIRSLKAAQVCRSETKKRHEERSIELEQERIQNQELKHELEILNKKRAALHEGLRQ